MRDMTHYYGTINVGRDSLRGWRVEALENAGHDSLLWDH